MTIEAEIDEEREPFPLISAPDLIKAYDEFNLMVERGTKAWADVPDATEWVEELRGNKE